MVCRGVNSPHENWSPPLWLTLPHMMFLKPLLPPNLFALANSINITKTMHHKQFPPTPSFPSKLLQQGCLQVKLTPHVSIETPIDNLYVGPTKICLKRSSHAKLLLERIVPILQGGGRQHETQFLLSFLIDSEEISVLIFSISMLYSWLY